MRPVLTLLLPLQRLFIPVLLITLLWALWRSVIRRDLAIGLALYIALVLLVDGFMNTGIYIPGLPVGSIRYSEVCAFFLFFTRPRVVLDRAPRRMVTWLFATYFFLLFVSVLRNSPILPGILEFRSVIIPQLVAFTLAKQGLDSPGAYRRFFMSLTVLILVVGVFDFWDLYFDRWLLKSEVLDKGIYAHNRELNRFGSVFLNPNYLGAFVVLVFPAIFIWTLNERQFRARVWGSIGLLSLLFCLVETQSRGPLLAFGLGLMLLMIGPCGGVSKTRRVGFLIAATIVFALFMPGFFEHASERFSKIDQETAEGRTRETTWKYTQRIIGDHPLFGIGYGEQRYMEMMTEYGFSEEFGLEPLDAPHNSYLQISVYAGVPALLAFLLANMILLMRAMRVSLKEVDPAKASAVFGLAVGLAGFLASIFPDIQLFTTTVAPIYWVFFGLLLSLVTVPEPAVAAAPIRSSFQPRRPMVSSSPVPATGARR